MKIKYNRITASEEKQIDYNVNDVDAQIRNYFRDKITYRGSGEDFHRGGYYYLIEMSEGGNVYRVFIDDRKREVGIQCIAEAVYNDGYNDARDYKWFKDAPIENWFDLVLDTINESESEGQYTEWFDSWN